jgi:hypothetical protein
MAAQRPNSAATANTDSAAFQPIALLYDGIPLLSAFICVHLRPKLLSGGATYLASDSQLPLSKSICPEPNYCPTIDL